MQTRDVVEGLHNWYTALMASSAPRQLQIYLNWPTPPSVHVLPRSQEVSITELSRCVGKYLWYCSISNDPYLLSNVSFSYHVLFGKKINRLNFHGQHDLQDADVCVLE